ncbi:hypothetical protein [Nesterenkonia massiliensis]|uniref:hypothetical protein n=1 Tax=Nesterenkonia massiliensis TaxID=1232429 RepID=UPI0003F69E17|nr:hypothetical protein [Nesterenkonia massiliensis]
MRFLYPVSAFLLGLILLGFGIGQLVPGEPEDVRSQPAEAAPFTVITDDLIDADEGHDEFTIEGDGEYSLAIGRAHDIEAWLGDAAYNRVTGVTDSADQAEIEVEHIEGEQQAPNPLNSDLWVATETTEGELLYRWSTPDTDEEWSLLVFRDGEAAAPVTISAERPAPGSQGLGITLVILGALAVLVALALFYRALGATRREAAADNADGATAASAGLATEPESSSVDSDDQTLEHPSIALPGAADADPAADLSSVEESSSAEPLAADHADSTEEHPEADEDETTALSFDFQDDSDDSLAETEVIDDEQNESQQEASETASEASASEEEANRVTADEAADPEDAPQEDQEHVINDDEPASEQSRSDDAQTPAQKPKGLRGRFGRGTAYAVVPAVAIALTSALGGTEQAYAATEEPEQTETDIDVAEEVPSEGYSVLLGTQLERILGDISEVVASADEEQDAEALQQRVAGHALEVRELSYRNHDLAESSLPAPIGTEVLSAAVTSETEFPRQAVVITNHPDGEVPQILILEQNSARENYKLIHASLMAPGTEFPSFSAEQGGVVPVDPEDESASEAPAQALRGVADFFADSEDEFGEQVAESIYLQSLHGYYEELAEAAEDTELSFPTPEMGEQITALELPDGSTLVAGSFELVMQMAPLDDGDTIFLEHDLVEELAGTDWTTFPTEISTTESVVLQIPADEDGEIVLLGIHDIISDASIDTPEWFEGYDSD